MAHGEKTQLERPCYEFDAGYPSATVHKLKCWPEFFQAIADGTKTFEVRVNDRGYEVGHFILEQEFDPGVYKAGGSLKKCYTGRQLKIRINYIARFLPGLPESVVVMSIAPAFEKQSWFMDLINLYGTQVGAWLNMPQKLLGDATPISCLLSGREKDVARVVDQLASGAFL